MPRVKPHAKLHTSIGNHRKTADLFADNDMLATYTRLLLLAVQRFADRTGDTFTLHASELMRVTGRGRADVALTCLRRLADMSPICVEPDGNMYRITIPNFSKKQGFRDKNRSETGHSSSSASSTSSTSLREESAPAPPVAPAPVKPVKRAAPEVPPEAAAFARDFRDAIARVHPGSKPPTPSAFAAWEQSARLMLGDDARPLADARDLAHWLFSDTGEDAAFWRPNVLSMPTFRAKYDRLRAVMGRAAGKEKRAETRGSSLLAWAYS